MPEEGSKFPPYKAGQYIALRRENCRLTKRVVSSEGKIHYVPDLDENGNQKRGPVTHSYSISSAPYETEQHGYLEFYVILERDDRGVPGRLTESLFQLNPETDNKVEYFFKIAGDFTLENRTQGYKNIVMVGTGSGLAPFASMIKQLHFEAQNGKTPEGRFTLIHANRGAHELGYHEELLKIEAAGKFDFLYVPSVSRPSEEDYLNPTLGKGRANNLLRHVFGMPLKEEQDLRILGAQRQDTSHAKAILDRTVRPVLPKHISKDRLLARMMPHKTVILCCGNPQSMDDVNYVAETNGIKFEKEEW
jgi:ferredoxin-NADP reductase